MLHKQKIEMKKYIIGIDEVGRGPIAGPVVVCACAIISGVDIIKYFPRQKLQDSKKLTGKRRQEILEKITDHTKSQEIIFGIGEVSAVLIDEIGISVAIKGAILQALISLHQQSVPKESFIFLDGSLYAPEIYQQETIIKGDEKIPEISLASIYAKEYRDTKMKEHAKQLPHYSFEKHVGYGTSAHYKAMKKHGLCELHRRSFLTKFLS